MLRLTRTAVGLLTAQYRSVLKKCWAINVGIFALGAMAATAIPTEAMAVIDASTLNNATVNTGTGAINWTYHGTSEPSGYTWYATSTSYPSGTQYVVGTAPNGSFALRVKDGTTTKYFTGTYTKPSNYGALARNTAFTNADAPNGGYYYNLGEASTTTNQGGAITISSNTITNPIIADFIKNGFKPNTTTVTSDSGGAIYIKGSSSSNRASITTIKGNFIGNNASSQGGAIYNYQSNITNLTGNFIGNIANGGNYAYGGAIYNYQSNITNLTGNFIGNIANGGKYAYGGAIYMGGGTISNLTGNFIGNSANYYGGAIYMGSGTITFAGDSYFAGNTAKSAPNDIYIYSSATINIGKRANVTLNSGYDGPNSSSSRLSISSGGTLTINEHDNGSGVRASNLGKVTNNGTFNIGVDIDASSVDTFNFYSYTGSGRIILNGINAIAGAYTANKDYIVLTGKPGDAVLTLPNGSTTSGSVSTVTSSSPVATAITNAMTWDTKYTSTWTDTTETYGVTLTSDRKGFKITDYRTSTTPNGSGDVLAAINVLDSGSTAKSYAATQANHAYTTTENLGTTVGTINVSGYGSDKTHSTLTIGSGYSGFDIGRDSTVNLQNLTLSGGTSLDKYAANINSGGTLKLNNVDVDSASVIRGVNGGNLNLTGDNTIGASLANYNGTTTVESGTTDFENTVNGFTVSNGALASVKASKLAGNITLASTGELELIADSNDDMDFSINDASSRNGILRVMSGGTGTIGTGSISANAVTIGDGTNAGSLTLGTGTKSGSFIWNGTTYTGVDTTPNNGATGRLITSGAVYSALNNYYRKNKKSGILNGFEEGEIGNEIGDFSQLAANDNFATTTFLRAI